MPCSLVGASCYRARWPHAEGKYEGIFQSDMTTVRSPRARIMFPVGGFAWCRTLLTCDRSMPFFFAHAVWLPAFSTSIQSSLTVSFRSRMRMGCTVYFSVCRVEAPPLSSHIGECHCRPSETVSLASALLQRHAAGIGDLDQSHLD